MQAENVLSSTPDTDKAFATQIVYESSVGALTLLLYDICITLDDEVKFVWPKPWSGLKFLFFFVRYIPLLVQIPLILIGSPALTPRFHFTPHACFIWQVYQGVATVLVYSAVDCVLILRVYALYHNNAIVRKLVLVAFGLEVSAMCVGLGFSLPTIQFDEICVVTHVSAALLIYGAATLLFQTFLFSLTAFKFVGALRAGWGDTPLVSLVMRDGTWAFLLLFAFVTGYAALYALKNHTFSGMLSGWLLTVFSFSGYRVLLNLNRLHDADTPRLPTSQTSTHASPFQFTTMADMTDRELDTSHSYELTMFRPTSHF
ncbi:hypothetical protein B0H17DRAFT_586501 [Mycena rosella]|uniref:DUF6533 domain-containing protein n=1 Tax=Mycena rosella TaxID=1033263 RepID=A0AAD7DJ09_MYCRO|nr:hypothetical protein B0H17DRAFT_586501 [Mycena rosella]